MGRVVSNVPVLLCYSEQFKYHLIANKNQTII